MVLVSTDYPLRSDLTGTVTEKGARFIKVAFDNRVPKWALKKKVRLDLYANDITFRRMEDNLKHLSLKGKNALEYSLNKRDPQPSKDSIYIDYIDHSLNESQKLAVKNSLTTQNFFLIHGPFGTGKTRTLVELISQEVRQNRKVLATAESNAAVDNIVERLVLNKKLKITRLGHPQRVSKDNITYTLAYKVENHSLNDKIKRIHKKIDKLIEKRSSSTPFQNFSNLNSNFVNNNKNLKINNQPNFNQDMNSKKNIKGLTDIKSTQTIMLNPHYQYKSNSSNSSKSQKNLIQYNNMNFQNKFPNNAQNLNKNINYYNGVYNQGYNPRF